MELPNDRVTLEEIAISHRCVNTVSLRDELSQNGMVPSTFRVMRKSRITARDDQILLNEIIGG